MPRYPFELYDYNQFKKKRYLVRKHSGIVTWRFSQNSSFVAMLAKRARSGPIYFRGGICLSLSANWILEHAKGSSLVTSLGLYMDGKKVIALNTDQLCVITYQQQSWNNNVAPCLAWLKSRDIIEVRRLYRKPVMVLRLPIKPTLKVGTGLASQAARMYGKGFETISVDLENVSSAYAMIVIRSETEGHAMVAWIGTTNSQDACFFDPNFGECWFKCRTNFFNFVAEYIEDFYPDMPHYEIYTLSPRIGGKCDNRF